MRSSPALVFVVSCMPYALAQPAAWNELRSKNPPGIEVSLRLTEARPYAEGELVQASVAFPVRPAPPGQPAKETWQFTGLLVDPAGACGSVAKPCFPSMPLGFNKQEPTLRIGSTSEPVAVSLNNYLPQMRPGRYRAAVLLKKLVLTQRAPMSASYGYADPAQYAISNVVEFEVVAASPAWIRQTIQRSVEALNSEKPRTREAYESRRAAAEQLAMIDAPPAWRAALSLLPEEEYVLLQGLAATRQPAQVCELMQTAIPAPAQVVSGTYLYALAQVCTRAKSDRREVSTRAAAALAASLPRKAGYAKTGAFQTLIAHVQQIRANRPPEPDPDWVPLLRGEFTKYFASTEIPLQRHLLGMYAGTFRGPELIPLLESVLDAWKPNDYYEAPREAIRNLHRIDPERARSRIVAELKRPRTWLHPPDLDLLPTGSAGITDDELIDALAADQRPGGWNPQLRMTALAKYATPKALSRVKAIYESQQETCQPELLAYFVRVEPAYAERVFRSHPWDMRAAPPPCTLQIFSRTPPIAMAPALERYMSAYLMHETVLLKTTAAQSLARFGSPAALPALWGAFRYFHEYWKGKQSQLAQNQEGGHLEVELRNAIARGRRWLVNEAGLRTIESLCVSERCLYETQQDLRAWDAGGFRGTVAHYYALGSMEARSAMMRSAGFRALKGLPPAAHTRSGALWCVPPSSAESVLGSMEARGNCRGEVGSRKRWLVQFVSSRLPRGTQFSSAAKYTSRSKRPVPAARACG
jgi:hypothetical protein